MEGVCFGGMYSIMEEDPAGKQINYREVMAGVSSRGLQKMLKRERPKGHQSN